MSINDVILRITSSDPMNKAFGTGFVFYRDKLGFYILTCAHVIEDVGGKNHVRASGLDTEIIYEGEVDGLDLAVVRINPHVEFLSGKAPLPLAAFAHNDQEVYLIGFYKFGNFHRLNRIDGKIKRPFELEVFNQSQRVQGWDIQFETSNDIHKGYSGAPVIDRSSDLVIGIAFVRAGSQQGSAISIDSTLLMELPFNIKEIIRPAIVASNTLLFDIPNVPTNHKINVDWNEAPEDNLFFGREQEIDVLKKWAHSDRCRVIAILGMQGVGKTKLSVRFGMDEIKKINSSDQVKPRGQNVYEYIVWKNLFNAPSLTGVLSELLGIFSPQHEKSFSDFEERELISTLISYFKMYRCLIVLDNMEAVMEGGNAAGQYREGHEGYGHLVEQVGKTSHQSCLILTSREKPQEVTSLEGKSKPVRSFEVTGLSEPDVRLLFNAIGDFSGDDEDWKKITSFYRGNPLALELTARHILEVFFGDISAFLKEGKPIFNNLIGLLDWHFERLSDLEREVMYWLAIEREPISFFELKEDLLSPYSKSQLSSTLQSLQHRMPIEKAFARFTLQPVLIEYITDYLIERVGQEINIRKDELDDYTKQRLIEKISEEISQGSFELLDKYALLKAVSKDYIRESQTRLILGPIIDRLIANFGNPQQVKRQLKQILSFLQQQQPPVAGYAAGNILNLLIEMKSDLYELDFSNLVIRQACLQNADLRGVQFSYVHFDKSTFAEIFNSVLAVTFNPLGDVIAIGGVDGKIRLWQVSDGKHLLTYSGHTNWIRSIAFSHDGQILASGSDDHTVRLWDVPAAQTRTILQGHYNQVRSVAFGPDDYILASSSDDQTIRLWDAVTGQSLHILQGHHGQVRSIDFSPDGMILASASDDQTICLWEVASGKYYAHLQLEKPVRSVAFSTNGDTLAVGDTDGIISLWDINTKRSINTLTGHTKWIASLDFSHDNTLLASGSGDKTIKIWDVLSGQIIRTLHGHNRLVWSVAFSTDGDLLASGSDDQSVKLWDVKTGKCVRTLQGHTSWVTSVKVSPDGQHIVSGGGDKTLKLWNTKTGKLVRIFHGHKDWIFSVRFSPDIKILASASDDCTIKLWDLHTGNHLKTLDGHSDRVRAVTFSPNGKMLASGSSDRTVKIWDIKTRRQIKTLQGHSDWVKSVVFSPDGTILASASDDQTICLWEITAGVCLKTLSGHKGRIRAIDFSADGKLIVSTSDDYSARLWDVESAAIIQIYDGHADHVKSVKFNPTKDMIATCSDDSTIRLWDIHTGHTLNILHGHTSWVTSLDFSPDGSLLVTGSQDNTIKIWDIENSSCIVTLRNNIYEEMNITGVTGLTESQKTILLALGAVDSP